MSLKLKKLQFGHIMVKIELHYFPFIVFIVRIFTNKEEIKNLRTTFNRKWQRCQISLLMIINVC